MVIERSECMGLTLEHLKVIGSERILINGGTDIKKKPIWIEGPHIFRKYGFYYLIAAEGGTGDQHSEVVFRSRNIDGPYVSYAENPILTQRHLDPRREHPITSTGHADLVETDSGDWWAVFLGCRPYRPYEEGFYNTGRETFLAPVRWQDGWPVINPEHENVQYSYAAPVQPSPRTTEASYSGNFTIRDEFTAPTLRGDWVFLRTPREKWYSLADRPGHLAIRLRPEMCSQPVNPSFIGWRQSHARGAASASLDFLPKTDRERAGLLVFQNEHHFYFLCKTLKDGVSVIELCRSATGDDARYDMELMTFRKLEDDPGRSRVFLKVEARGDTYAFFYASRPDEWHLVREGVPATFLSTKVAGGFVGCFYALYATSLGSLSANTAFFDWFEYVGDDEVYR